MLPAVAVEDHSTAARLKAARALAGKSVIDLAGDLPAGLGRGTLQLIERGGRDLTPDEVILIAQACGVDPSFFLADLTDMSTPPARLVPLRDPQTEAMYEQAQRILRKTRR